MGRTGTFFGFEKEGIVPDIITLAKGLGGGLPLGAMITVGNQVPHFQPGQHGSTFGGNPVSVRAGLATIEVIEREKLSKNALAMSKKIRKAVQQLDAVEDVRGEGLLLGIVLKDEIAKYVAGAASNLGLLVNAPNEKVIRIAPALITKEIHVIEFARKFTQALEDVAKESKES
jgi:acetylornithine aminotransferase